MTYRIAMNSDGLNTEEDNYVCPSEWDEHDCYRAARDLQLSLFWTDPKLDTVEVHIKNNGEFATKNEAKIRRLNYASCVHCFTVSPADDVVEWIPSTYSSSKTAVCPECSVDALVAGKYDRKLLRLAYINIFGED